MPLADPRRAVRRPVGCSPEDHLLSIRLNRAKGLLAGAPTLPVAAVARRVGYDDAACFTRLFARRAGQPPSEFRAQRNRGFAAGEPRDGGT
ncbi:helix-turn-helix domain-containing protein [Nonomuraea sp. NPDC003214]